MSDTKAVAEKNKEALGNMINKTYDDITRERKESFKSNTKSGAVSATTTEGKSSSLTQQESNYKKSLENLLEKAQFSNFGAILQKFQPVIDLGVNLFHNICPYLILAWNYSYKFYNSLPLDILYSLVGLVLVFFGGVYCLLIAAVETFYMTGWPQIKEGVMILKEEFELMWEAHKKDNEIDEDHDGIADVDKLSYRELAQRKFLLFLQSCRDPQKVINILTSITTSIISVIAVLKVEFAKVIALGNMIGENLKKPVNYYLVPAAGSIVPKQYQKWIAPTLEFLCKVVSISIAWFIQRVISSVQSAIRGGLLFSRRFLIFLKNRGWFSSYDEDDYYDEALGWSVAAIGIYFQLSCGFGLPFPLNILLFPVSCLESYLTWVVSN